MSETLAQRRKRFAITSAAGVLLIGAILILVNILSNWLFFRVDMTHSHAYSLSPSSKRLVRQLEDPIIIKVFFTPNLPAPYNVYERYVRDTLTEYRAASKGKVRFEFVLPYPPADFEKQAQEAGLFPLQMEEQGSDQLSVRRVFMGMVLEYGDKTETIPVVKDIQQLEYELTSKIARMAVRQKRTIYYSTGSGEPEWLGAKSHVAADLSSFYDVKPLNLTAGATQLMTGDGLIVLGPTRKLSDQALWTIDQTLMRGAPVAFLVDAKSIYTSQFVAAPLDTGLAPLLKHYGVDMGDRLVYDAQAETIGIQQSISGFVIPMQIQYPFIPVITHFTTSHPLARGLETVALPFGTTVDSAQPMPPGLTFTPLFQSTARSWLWSAASYNINPGVIRQPKGDEPHGPYVMGGVVEGTFTSYFQGKPSPFPKQPLIATSPKTSIVVIGSSHMVDPAMPEFRGANALMANLMAWVARDDVLLGIRAKGDILRPLKPLTDRQRDAVKAVAVVVPPLLAAALGFIRWRRRQAWRRRLGAVL